MTCSKCGPVYRKRLTQHFHAQVPQRLGVVAEAAAAAYQVMAIEGLRCRRGRGIMYRKVVGVVAGQIGDGLNNSYCVLCE